MVTAWVMAASFGEVLLRVVFAIAIASVTTVLSLRLLGGRRGWSTGLVAGLIGWGLAAVVALGLNDWDWGADGLFLHMLAIGIPTTMLVAVGIDLLSRPGTLASGFGHLGDGNIHFHVRGDADVVQREGKAISQMVYDLVNSAGGSISAEHGIGQMKKDELERLSPDRVRHLRAIKSALDPKSLMNPGKLI